MQVNYESSVASICIKEHPYILEYVRMFFILRVLSGVFYLPARIPRGFAPA